MNSVVFSSPLLFLGFALAWLLDLLEVKKHVSGYVFPLLSLVLFCVSLSYAFLLGASFAELSIVIMLFMMLAMSVYLKDGRARR